MLSQIVYKLCGIRCYWKIVSKLRVKTKLSDRHFNQFPFNKDFPFTEPIKWISNFYPSTKKRSKYSIKMLIRLTFIVISYLFFSFTLASGNFQDMISSSFDANKCRPDEVWDMFKKNCTQSSVFSKTNINENDKEDHRGR